MSRRKAVTIAELLGIALFLIGAGFVCATRISAEQAKKASLREVQKNSRREKRVTQQKNPPEFSIGFQRMFDSLNAERHKKLPHERNFSPKEKHLLDSAMRNEAHSLLTGSSTQSPSSTRWKVESIERVQPSSSNKTSHGKRN